MERIVELLLYNNQLRSLPTSLGTRLGRSLTSLALNNNAFDSLPDALLQCRQLRALYLSNNRIRAIPPRAFAAWRHLLVFTAARNALTSIPSEIALCTALKELNLAGNRILRIPPELARCAALKDLDLSSTDLVALPASLHSLAKLQTLALDGCPLLVPPPAVVARGVAAIRRHLADLHAASTRCLRIKLLLVGRENIGKTSVARALARAAVAHISAPDPAPLGGSGGNNNGAAASASGGALSSSGGSNDNESSPKLGKLLKLGKDSKRLLSTDGIAIETIALDYLPANGGARERGALQCHVWDFAGQDLYGATHQFFVSPHSIFLVCFDLREPESTSSVQHWLETIAAHIGPDAPVMLVGTHLDDPQCTDVRVDAILDHLYDKYQERFPGIFSYAPVSATTGLGIPELRSQIEAVASRTSVVGRALPPPVVALDAALVQLRATRVPPVINWSEWTRLCAQCGIGPDPGLDVAQRGRENTLPSFAVSTASTLSVAAATVAGDDDNMSIGGGGGDDDAQSMFSDGDMPTDSRLSTASSVVLLGRGARRNTLLTALDDVKRATDMLHALGSLLFFDDAGTGLNDVVVLHPQWLADALATIVTTKQQFARGGVLTLAALAHIWKAPRFPPALHADLLALLENFDLVHRLRAGAQIGGASATPASDADARFVVPLLLPAASADQLLSLAHRVAPTIGRYWSFATYVPPGFFGRLVTRVARIASVDAFFADCLVAGFRAEARSSDASGGGEQRSTRALVRFADSECMLRIETGGPRAAALQAVLIEAVESLANTWFQIETTAFMPCPHCLRQPAPRAAPFLFRHDEALRAAAAKQATMMCRGVTPVPLLAIAPDITLSELDSKRIDLRELRLLRELARGGFGVVHEAQWRGQLVAVKVMMERADSADGKGVDASAFAEFRREVHFMIGLRDTNIVCLLAFALDPRALVMELVLGGDLYSYLHKSPLEAPLDEPLRLKVAWDVAAGMRYLHSVNPPVVHRDLKSPNILLASHDPEAVIVAKVTDFGLSVRDFGGAVRDGADRAITNPTWLAPEVLLSNSFTTASDVYAFGLVLWELQTRQHPWEAETFQFMYQLEDAVTKGRRPLLPLDVEPKLAELTTRAWAANPLERPTFVDLCVAIARVAAQRAPHIHASRVSASGEASTPRERRPTVGVTDAADDDELLPERVQFLNRSAVSPPGRVMSLAVVKEAGHVWCGSATGFVTVYEAVAPGRALFSWRAHDGAVVALLYAFGSMWSASDDGSVRVWQCVADVEPGEFDEPAGGSAGALARSIDEQVMPKGAALAQHVYGARASQALAVEEAEEAAPVRAGLSGRSQRRTSFVIDRIEQAGVLAVSNRKGFRPTWKQRRCELRDDGVGDSTLMIYATDKKAEVAVDAQAKDVVRIVERSVVLAGLAAVALVSELKGRPHGFVLIRGDQLNRALLFDAGSAEECERWVAQLGAAIARVKQRAELTLLRHTIALPNGSAAMSLRLPPGDEQSNVVWCAAERPGAIYWIDAIKGVVACTLSYRDVFRGESSGHTGSAPPCAGAALGVMTNMWVAALDNSIALCEARSGRCSARLVGHRGVVQVLARVHDEVWSGARDSTIRLWRAVDGKPLAVLECARSVHALVHCGRVVWSGGADATLTMWSVAERVALLQLPSHNSDVLSTIVAVGERCVWAGSWDGTVTLWTGPAHDWRWRPPARDATVELADAAAAVADAVSTAPAIPARDGIATIVAPSHRFSAGFAVAAAKRERLLGIRRAPAVRNIAVASPLAVAATTKNARRGSNDAAIDRPLPQPAMVALRNSGEESDALPPLPPTPQRPRQRSIGAQEFAELLADENSN